MTNLSKAHRSREGSSGGEDNLLSALWAQQAHSFPRLPADAPAAIANDTIDVKDPERVYRIYRASRRHQFQLLVEAFILQIRYGCCASSSTSASTLCNCSTPTCFTYRRRAVGSKPIRRFHSTSARQLAVTLASQDNPESALCPHLRSQQGRASSNHIQKPSKQSSLKADKKKHIEALNEVLIKSGHKRLSRAEHRLFDDQEQEEGSTENTDLSISSTTSKTNQSESPSSTSTRHRSAPKPPIDKWTQEQEDVKLDPRSFVQNVFNTDAMRMLEWLTPSYVDRFTLRIKQALDVSPQRETERSEQKPSEKEANVGANSPTISKIREPAPTDPHNSQQIPASEEPASKNEEISEATETPKSALPPLNKHRRRSDLRGTSPPGSKPYTSSVLPDLMRRESSDLEKPTKLARVNSFSDDNGLQRRKSSERRTKMNLSPSIKSISAFGHEVLPTVGEFPVALPKFTIITPPEPAKKTETAPKLEESPATMTAGEQKKASLETPQPETLPQSLSVLSDQSLKMLCAVLRADAPLDLYAKPHQVVSGGVDPLAGKRLPNSAPAWRAFAEQSFFYVLSDSKALLSFFTDGSGNLVSNIRLPLNFWRIQRVAPDVMLDALWIAAGDLFQMPMDLAELQEPKKHSIAKLSADKTPLKRREAGYVVAILFNALTAMLPTLTKDGIYAEETYRERQNGHSYIHGKPAEVNLAMDDALSNDLALRLAKRLFTALSVRDSFRLLSHRNGLSISTLEDGVQGLFQTLSGEISGHGGAQPYIDAEMIRTSNEQTRVLGLGLRAWATKIFVEEWDGSPIIPQGGAIGGALLVLTALNTHRDWVLEYSPPDALVVNFISDRLDASDIPVEWLSWSAKSRQDHLLNYPFLFPKETLVTYFRAINFSRMSAAYDNAVGIHHRIQALAQPSTLVTGNARMNYLCEKLRVAMSRFMVLNIRRTSSLEDAFDQLWRREERELLRPLKIKLGEDGGELGSDSGGVQAEFFRLAIAEALNPDYGCFTLDERTKMAWFVPSSAEPSWKFELIGLLFGMAIYNGLTLPVTLPHAFYAKLLGKKIESWMDIQDGWPDLASGFQTLLEWDESNGTVEDVFCRTYEFSVEAFGNPISRSMQKMPSEEDSWPQFSEVVSATDHVPKMAELEDAPMVTKENRAQYVKDYITFLINHSIAPQFTAFQKGFLRVIDTKSITLFTPSILQEVVEGVQEVDIAELERVVRYEGYTSSSPTIRDFWAVVKAYGQEERKKLLEFVTASDRVPVGGMTGITFVIQRNGQAEDGVGWGDESLEPTSALPTRSRANAGAEPTGTGTTLRASAPSRAEQHRNAVRAAAAAERAQEEKEAAANAARLPTAYTCYGTLLLPEYRDRETLKRKLGMALENAKGFGFA